MEAVKSISPKTRMINNSISFWETWSLGRNGRTFVGMFTIVLTDSRPILGLNALKES